MIILKVIECSEFYDWTLKLYYTIIKGTLDYWDTFYDVDTYPCFGQSLKQIKQTLSSPGIAISSRIISFNFTLFLIPQADYLFYFNYLI